MPVYLSSEEEMVPRLMVLRGSPGVGKSTISKSINKINSANKKTYISVDAMQHLDLRTPCRNKEKLGIKNAAIISSSFLEEGFDVVLDYVFDDVDDIKTTIDIIREHNTHFFLQIFYLDAPIEKVLKRNQSRSGKRGEYMNTALLKKLYAKVAATKNKVDGEIVLDTSNFSAKQTARVIISNSTGFLDGINQRKVDLSEADKKRAIEQDEGEDE